MRRFVVPAIAASLTVLVSLPAAHALSRSHASESGRHDHFRRIAAAESRQLKAARLELAAAHNQMASLRAANATLRAQIGTLQAQAATLQGELDQAVKDRDSARAQVAQLQARLDAIPTPLDTAVQQVQEEVAWSRERLDRDGIIYSVGELTSLAAMDYVEGHVNSRVYNYLVEHGGAPAANSNAILGAQAGVCGHHVIAMAAILNRFGYSVRSANFYWIDTTGNPNGHSATEVYYDGGWHYFDSMYGLFWTGSDGTVLSITDVRAQGGTEYKDQVAYPYELVMPSYTGTDTEFETDPATQVVLGQYVWNP